MLHIMDWITTVVQIVTLLACPIWLYLWLNKSTKRKRPHNHDLHYTVPGWHFVLKRWWATKCITEREEKKEKKRRRKAQVQIEGRIRKLPGELEALRTLKDEDSSDSILFYAADQKANSLLIKLTRRRHRTAELWMQLSLADGRSYQLPNNPDTLIFNNVSRGWTAAGLKIVPLESWRRWRITFNGLLRNGIRRNYRQDAGKIEHVRFNFIYISASTPILWPQDWSPGLQGDALAREPWKNPEWIDMIRMDDSGGFDQWGSLIGQVTFEDSSNTELYLRGIRQRRWGKNKASHLYRTVSILGVMHNGAMYCLGANSSRGRLTHAQFGHIRLANGLVQPIDWTDFNLKNFAEDRENIPTKFTINFKADGKKYNTVISRVMDSGSTLYGGRPWEWEARVFDLTTDLNADTGVGLAQLWYSYGGLCPLKSVPRVRNLLQPDVKPEPGLYITSFRDRLCQSETVVGGKGSSLALLTSVHSKEFLVPQGFCVTVSALNLQIEITEALSHAVVDVANVSTGKKEGDLKEACERAVALFETIPVVKPVMDEIQKALKDLESFELASSDEPKDITRYAVRSSAIGEDSEDTSAAGQNSTFLGIKGADNIVKAVAKCWASLYAYQSVEYRRQHGQPIQAEMGVCVQRMVKAEAAGVMFTRHPTTGDPRKILITANYGLGESVVSAMIEPDTIIMDRSWDNALTIKDTTLGTKTQKVTMNDEGTTTEELDESESKKLCISEDVVLHLGKLGLDIEALFGTARDVEWAIAEGQVFLLQARPVTALDAWTDFELTHELDSGVPSDVDVLTFANVGEVLPGAISPLTLSTVVRFLDNSIEVGSMRLPANPYYESCVCTSMMRCVVNYLDTVLTSVEDKVVLSNKVVDIAMCGHVVTTPEIHAIAKERNGVMNYKSKLRQIVDMFKDTWNNEKIVEAAKELEKNFVLDPPRFLKADHLYKEIDDNLQILCKTSVHHGHTSRVSVFCQIFTMSILMEGAEEFAEEHHSDMALLLTSCSDVVSAAVPTALREIAHSIRRSGKSEEFTQLEPAEAQNWLRINSPSAARLFDNFLQKHGHRCIKEFDFITETWDLKPENLLSMIQATVSASGEAPLVQELSVEETVAQLKTPKSAVTKWILRKVMPLCRTSVARREMTKALLISIEHKFRLAYRRLGRLMVEEGRLPDDNLLFMLTHQEIGLLLHKRDPMLVQKAVRRRRLYPQLDKLQFQELNIGIIKPMVVSDPLTKTYGGAAQIRGTPVYGGTVLGRACVVIELSEAKRLRLGDILVTHSTDIGWSPYFPMLGGVVTELGGLISHGAVVAREYGLPCVVGAQGATQIFQTGDTVLLNGNTGILQAVEETN